MTSGERGVPGAGAPAATAADRAGAATAARPLGSLVRDQPLWLQLVAAVLALVSLALVVSGLSAAALLRQDLQERLDRQLVGVVTGDGRGPGAALGMLRGGERRGGPDELNAYYVALASPAGVLLREPLRTGQSPPALPPLTREEALARGGRPFTVPAVDGDDGWRVLLVPLGGDGRPGQGDGSGVGDAAGPVDAVVAVALSTSGLEATLARLGLITATVGLAVLLGTGAAAYLIVRSSLRPLVEVEHTAAAIAAGDLARRVPQRSPATETGRLALALNAMLGQIERAFGAQRASEAEARRSEQRMRQFVADASHELRTPLTSIRGFAELYRQGAVTAPGDVDRVMGRVEGEASRMGALVEELLLLARLDQQRPLDRAPVDLGRLAADAVGDLRAVARDRDVRLTVTAEAGPPVVLGDEARLRQVLANLLANARVHTPAGTPVTVTVGTGPPGGGAPDGGAPDGGAPGGGAPDGGAPGVWVEVADEGPGLTAEQAERVFERFYRADTARTRAAGGSGLGLSIVAAIVAAHDGEVGVRSEPGRGAVFRVCLPSAPAG